MSLVEDAYRQSWLAMPPEEKLARAHALLKWVRDLYARQLREELGDVSEERLRWEVALRLYKSEPKIRELIERRLREL